MTTNPPVFITGIAGFIGFHTACRYIRDGRSVVGIDNFNDYYDPQLKRDRVAFLQKVFEEHKKKQQEEKEKEAATTTMICEAIDGDLTDLPLLQRLFQQHKFEVVIHLAAQAGVRYSLTNPHAYVQSNLVGFVNMLECCRHGGAAAAAAASGSTTTSTNTSSVKHFVYASSSSVYGGNTKTPYAESDSVDHPMSMYAATKKSNEVLAHSYAHLYQLPCTGLRFFTVYGPWGRPDMAVWGFTERITSGRAIELFDHGRPRRDFTYIDDIVEGIVRVALRPPEPQPQLHPAQQAQQQSESSAPPLDLDLDPGVSWAPFRIMNIGGSQPHSVLEFVSLLERAIGNEAEKRLVDAQPGDVDKTEADTARLTKIIQFVPQVTLEEGLKRWWAWYAEYTKKE